MHTQNSDFIDKKELMEMKNFFNYNDDEQYNNNKIKKLIDLIFANKLSDYGILRKAMELGYCKDEIKRIYKIVGEIKNCKI